MRMRVVEVMLWHGEVLNIECDELFRGCVPG